jgi:hypothetical protein
MMGCPTNVIYCNRPTTIAGEDGYPPCGEAMN